MHVAFLLLDFGAATARLWSYERGHHEPVRLYVSLHANDSK